MRDSFAGAHELLVERLSSSRAHTENPADPSTVQAMQIALHLPKGENTPRWTPLLRSAARSVVKLCLDERAVTDPEWQKALTQWYDHLIRKIARRGRNAAWEHVQNEVGVTVETEGAQARAFIPSAVNAVPAAIKKLQIKGTDLPVDEEAWAPIDQHRVLIGVNADLGMTLGKCAAQVGHGSMLLAADRPLEFVRQWREQDFDLDVRLLPESSLQRIAQLRGAVVVRDAGFTEVAPHSATVVAWAPESLTTPEN